MIRHQVYFDLLGSMKEESPAWRSAFAGLSVLRLVDSYMDGAVGMDPPNWAQLHSVRAAVDAVNEGYPVRGVLLNVLEEVSARGVIDDTVSVALLAYGRALDYEAQWTLAMDVFSTVAKSVKPQKNARLAVEANIAVGGAARRNGDWDASARAYSQAAYIADTMGDRPGVLTVQVGIANTYIAKGNLPQAQTILDDVVTQARDQQLPEVEGIALHSRSSLAARMGAHSEALRMAHDALNLTTNPTARDGVLEDIAAIFSEVGMRDAARDAHLVLAATARSQLIRWTAAVNLLELASKDGMEASFDSYARELSAAPLPPWLRAHFLLFRGEGLHRFGRLEAAEEILRDAIAFADANQYHQTSFAAQAAIARVRSAPRAAEPYQPTETWVAEDVASVARAILELRKAAVAN